MSIETISYIPKDELQKIIGQNIRKIAYEKNMNLMKLSEQVDISYEYLRCIVSKNGKKKSPVIHRPGILLIVDEFDAPR